jgi:hypothetical protein
MLPSVPAGTVSLFFPATIMRIVDSDRAHTSWGTALSYQVPAGIGERLAHVSALLWHGERP